MAEKYRNGNSTTKHPDPYDVEEQHAFITSIDSKYRKQAENIFTCQYNGIN